MTESMEWSKTKTLEFISCYKACSILWDAKHEYYKDRLKRHEALETLAQKFGTLTTEVERKIKNLQSHFLRERKRLMLKNKYETSWFAYKPLTFLLTRDKERTARAKAIANAKSKAVESAPIAAPKSTNAGPSNGEGETHSPMYEMFKWFRERDEFDLYGEQVAIKLRSIASPYAQVMVQSKINMLLMEAKMGISETNSQYSTEVFYPISKAEVVEQEDE